MRCKRVVVGLVQRTGPRDRVHVRRMQAQRLTILEGMQVPLVALYIVRLQHSKDGGELPPLRCTKPLESGSGGDIAVRWQRPGMAQDKMELSV